METLTVSFEHCHGIAKLSHRFKFSNRCFAIYAPNGTMKTSFAKTFDEYSKNTDTKDNAFPDNATVREITIDDAKPIDRESILVIEPYNETYKSEKITTLLANKELKGQYEKLHKIIDEHQNTIVKKLKMLSGIGKDEVIHKEIKRIFGDNLINIVKRLNLLDGFLEPELSEFKVADITKDKIKEILKDSAPELQDYVDKYNELLNKSKYLKKEFNFYNIETINKQLENNNFFKNGHSVQLSDGETNSIFHTSKELEDLCETEKKQLLTDTELLKKFEKINKKLDGNNDLREFRALLSNKPELMLKFNDLNQFEKDIWTSYFYKEKELIQELVKEYTSAQSQIAEIIAKANDQRTGWEDAIDIFNDRFIHLPFSLKISNKSDSILNSNIVPVVDFEFQSKGRTKLYNADEKKALLDILSNGEKRALYILNIIFEIEARKKFGIKTLLIFDDVADSFDYKNKYAIIDYLQHISDIDHFRTIILTHNFDFYRTIQSRNIIPYEQCLMAIKDTQDLVELKKAKYLKNPFKALAGNINSTIILISLIPFVRNIIEYTRGEEDQDYLKLTSLLHFKDETYDIDILELKRIFSSMPNIIIPDRYNDTDKVIQLIYQAADECLTLDGSINLENKLVLSIAIRVKTEEFIYNKIDDEEFKQNLNGKQNQTWRLVTKYSEIFNNEKAVLRIINKVQLITPENIHINSFMYEPILDMSDIELKKLYNEVKQIESKLIK